MSIKLDEKRKRVLTNAILMGSKAPEYVPSKELGPLVYEYLFGGKSDWIPEKNPETGMWFLKHNKRSYWSRQAVYAEFICLRLSPRYELDRSRLVKLPLGKRALVPMFPEDDLTYTADERDVRACLSVDKEYISDEESDARERVKQLLNKEWENKEKYDTARESLGEHVHHVISQYATTRDLVKAWPEIAGFIPRIGEEREAEIKALNKRLGLE